MRTEGIWASAIAIALFVGCSSSSSSDEHAPAQTKQALAVGSIPSGLPAHVMVGLFESNGASWMKSSGVPWDVRYAYFTYGWANNWGYGQHDGSWGKTFLDESSAAGFIPTVEYDVMPGEPGGGEPQFLAKTQNAQT